MNCLRTARQVVSQVASFANLQSRTLTSASLQFVKFGDPIDVIKMKEIILSDSPEPGKVLVKMLASPINPADINSVQGVYPIKPDGFPPGTGGNEGVGEVIAIGDNVQGLGLGDWVIPANAGIWGTWSSHVLQPSQNLLKIPNDIPLLSAATLAVNPCTAYRMLMDFVCLSPGASFLQNGANSAVGQAAIQIAKHLGYNSINIVRPREDMDELLTYLSSLGADIVITDAELRNPKLKETLKAQDIDSPKLALDCVGGQTATDMLRIVSHGSTMVTYGGMSKQPMKVPVSALIFKDVRIKGFWMSEWNKQNRGSNPESQKMIEFLANMIREGKLKTPKLKEVPFSDFKNALSLSMTSMTTEKQVLIF